MTRVIYTHLVPPAMRLATLAITLGFVYAIADLIASIARELDGDPTRIPQQSNASDPMVDSQRKGNVMNKIIFTTVAGLILSTSTSLADNDRLGQGMAPVSNALEIAIGGGYMRSGGDIGRNMAGVDDLTRNGGGAELSVGYRLSPQLAIGMYGTLSGYQVGDAVAPTTDLAIGSTLGVKADWHFRPAMAVDPWVSIGTGWRGLWIGNDAKTERAYHGLELTRVQFGVDYRISPTFALAPYMGASAAMFLAEDTMASNGYDEIPSNEVNFSFTAGLMARFDLPFGAR